MFDIRRCVDNALSLGCSYQLGFGHGVLGGQWSWCTAVNRASASGSARVLRIQDHERRFVLHMIAKFKNPNDRVSHFSLLSVLYDFIVV